MGWKHVQTDQGYQSHRLWSDLDTYMWRYWPPFKNACNRPQPWGRAAALYLISVFSMLPCLHIFLHTLFTEHLTTRIITYEIQGTELYLINVNQFTQFFLIYITSFIYSVLAPSTSSVPLATTEFRIGRRAEILHLCWQLVFDAPVAEFPTLLFTLTHTHYFVYKLHL